MIYQPLTIPSAAWGGGGQTLPKSMMRAMAGLPTPGSANGRHSRVADMQHRRTLRSASNERLDVSTCSRSTIGGRAFPVAGAKVWNGLPSDVTSALSSTIVLVVPPCRQKTAILHLGPTYAVHLRLIASM